MVLPVLHALTIELQETTLAWPLLLHHYKELQGPLSHEPNTVSDHIVLESLLPFLMKICKALTGPRGLRRH